MKILQLDSYPNNRGWCSIGDCNVHAIHTISLPGITHGLCALHYKELLDDCRGILTADKKEVRTK